MYVPKAKINTLFNLLPYRMKVFYKFLALLFVLCLSAGCATTQSLSAQDRQAIETITVDPTVKMPDGLYYMGPGIGYLAVVGGMVGAVASCLISESTDKQLQAYIVAHHIHIDQIVRAQLIQQLPNAGLKVVAQGPADATIDIEIKLYGFSVPQSFSTRVVPILRVKADMVRNNQIVWSSSYYVDPMFGKMPKYKPSDLLSDSQVINNAWNLAAQEASAHIISTLKN